MWRDLRKHAQVVYSDERTILMNGDCLKLMPELRDRGFRFDFELTDPPYGVVDLNTRKADYDRGRDASLELALSAIDLSLELAQPRASFVVWCAFSQFGVIHDLLEHSGLDVRPLPWVKHNPMPMHPFLGNAVEFSVLATPKKSKLWNYSKSFQWNVLAYRSVIKADRGGHPTAKPTRMMMKLVRAATNESGVVFDPFAGSGPVLRASKYLKRFSLGIELDGKFCEETARYLRNPENDASLTRPTKIDRCIYCAGDEEEP